MDLAGRDQEPASSPARLPRTRGEAMDKQEAAPRADGAVLSADVLQAVMFALENTVRVVPA